MKRIEDYSDDLGIPGKDNDFGYGRLNGFRLFFGDVPSYLALYGWEITGGNNDGYPEKGETFTLKPVIKNIGVSDTLRITGVKSQHLTNLSIGLKLIYGKTVTNTISRSLLSFDMQGE